MAKIKFKRTSTAGRKPTGLESGEIGINLTDRKIYVGNDSGAIVQLGNDPIITDRLEAKKGATISGGTVTINGNQSNTGTLTTTGAITSNADVKGATLTTAGRVSAGSVVTTGATNSQTLTVTGSTVLAGTKTGALESTTLNATGVATVASLQTAGSISAGGNAVVTGKVTAGSLDTGAIVSTADVKGVTGTYSGRVTTGSLATGAITGSSVVLTGDVKAATATITGKATSLSLETGAAVMTGINTGTLTATGATSLQALTATTVNGTAATMTGLTTTGTLRVTGTSTMAAVNGTAITASGQLKGATLNVTGISTLTTVNAGAITGSTVTTTGDITTATKIKADSIEISKFDNFDSRYIMTGTSITNAEKLRVPRKIAGVNFDGSADITIPAANVGALAVTGGALTGNVTSTGDFTTNKVVEGQQVRSTYRMGILRTGGTPGVDFVRPDINSTDTLPATNQIIGMIAFKEKSATTDPHAGVARGVIQTLLMTDGSSRLYLDTRDNAGAIKNRMIMDGNSGLTTFDVGGFRVTGATTLGTTTTGPLTASTANFTSAITAASSLSMTSPNAGIELGSLNTAGTPFIDFHTSGTNVDYNIRLIASPTSLSVSTPGTTLDAFNLTSTTAIRLHQTAASQIVTKNDATIIRDFGNGNVTLSAGRTATDDTVGGDLYLGYTSTGNKCFTKSVRLEAPMTWKGLTTQQLVNASGKLVGASLDTAYLPLTGGALTGNISITRSGSASLEMTNTAVDTSVALPATNITMGHFTNYEKRAGTNVIRGRVETIITPTGGSMLQTYVRDSTNTNKVITRLESDTSQFNISQGNFRVAGTSTLVGAVSTGALTNTGGVTFNSTPSVYDITSLNTAVANSKSYLRKFRGGNGDTIWHETVQNNVYRLSTGNTDVNDVMTVLSTGDMVVKGSITAENDLFARNSVISAGGRLVTRGDGNSHLWFNTAGDVEKAVIYSGADKQFNIRANGLNWNFGNSAMIHSQNVTYGDSSGIIRGEVAGGGHGEWRARPSGLQLDCPNAHVSAYNVWKATRWGNAHIAAMDVHMQNGVESGAIVRLIVGADRQFNFHGTGDFIVPGNIGNNSDIRLKTNLVKIDSALDKVDQLNGYSYDKRNDLESDDYSKKEIGLIAQDVQKVLPGAVIEDKESSILSISYSGVNALLVEAIKELRAEVNELKKQITK
ncbi:hypothetical protein D3C75_185350 [compost metagenome]